MNGLVLGLFVALGIIVWFLRRPDASAPAAPIGLSVGEAAGVIATGIAAAGAVLLVVLLALLFGPR